jgi:excisionase family DNA binding protein
MCKALVQAFTVAQAAAELGYSRAMVYRLIAGGLLGCRRLPGKGGIRILRKHIDAFNEAYECPAKPIAPVSSGEADAANGTSLTAIAGLARAQRTAQRLSASSTPFSTLEPGQ